MTHQESQKKTLTATATYTEALSPDACRRRRLAALGRVVEGLTPLRAVVQEPVDGGLVLYVTPSYKSDVRETVSCELREGTWFFYYEWGDPICSADELTRAARNVASIMGIRI